MSVDEARLKRVWTMPPHGPHDSARAIKLEVHDNRWAFLDDRQIARGLATVGDPLRLRCLGEKLLAGLPAHVSVLGGSVSFGTTFTTSRSKALFHWKVYQYLNDSFAGAPHEHFMGAVPASGPSYMEHCLAWHLPPVGADLVLVEYAVNFDSVADDAESFERLIRRLIRLPNHPAIVIVNTMELVPPGGRLPWDPDDGSLYPSAADLRFDYKTTGAEDAINAIADYYGVPCVSLRGAIFGDLKSNSTRYPMKKIYHDRHHPSAWGHSLMAQMVVNRIRDAIAEVKQRSRRGAGGGIGAGGSSGVSSCAVAAHEVGDDGPRLWRPLYSRGEEAAVGACYKDQQLAERIHSAKGFKYLVEGVDAKMKPGIIGMHSGDSVQFCIDVSRLQGDAPLSNLPFPRMRPCPRRHPDGAASRICIWAYPWMRPLDACSRPCCSRPCIVVLLRMVPHAHAHTRASPTCCHYPPTLPSHTTLPLTTFPLASHTTLPHHPPTLPSHSLPTRLPLATLTVGGGFVFILGHLISYEHMGVARVSCVDECECESIEVDAHVPGGKFSVFKAKTFQAKKRALPPSTAADPLKRLQGAASGCGCKVEITILPKSGSGEHKFKILSLMTANKEGSLRYGHQAGFNNRPMEARFQ